MLSQKKTPPERNSFWDGQSNFSLSGEESRVRDLDPFTFGQLQNVIYIGVFPLNQPAHGSIESKEG